MASGNDQGARERKALHERGPEADYGESYQHAHGREQDHVFDAHGAMTVSDETSD